MYNTLTFRKKTSISKRTSLGSNGAPGFEIVVNYTVQWVIRCAGCAVGYTVCNALCGVHIVQCVMWCARLCSALCGVHGANLVLAEKIQLRCGHSAETTSHEARRRGHLLLAGVATDRHLQKTSPRAKRHKPSPSQGRSAQINKLASLGATLVSNYDLISCSQGY